MKKQSGLQLYLVMAYVVSLLYMLARFHKVTQVVL